MDTPRNGLVNSIDKLEKHLKTLEDEYGDQLSYMRDQHGEYLVTPILAALVKGYAALHKIDL